MFIQKGQILWVFVAVTFKTTLFCPKNHDPSYGNIRPFLMHPNAGFLLGLKTGWFWKVHDILTVFLGWIKLLEASIPAPLSCCFLALLRGRVFTRWCGFNPALGGKILGLTKSHQDEMVLFQTYVYIYIYGWLYIYINIYTCIFVRSQKICLLHGLRNLENDYVIQKRSFIPLRKAQYWFWTEPQAFESLMPRHCLVILSKQQHIMSYQVILQK